MTGISNAHRAIPDESLRRDRARSSFVWFFLSFGFANTPDDINVSLNHLLIIDDWLRRSDSSERIAAIRAAAPDFVTCGTRCTVTPRARGSPDDAERDARDRFSGGEAEWPRCTPSRRRLTRRSRPNMHPRMHWPCRHATVATSRTSGTYHQYRAPKEQRGCGFRRRTLVLRSRSKLLRNRSRFVLTGWESGENDLYLSNISILLNKINQSI